MNRSLSDRKRPPSDGEATSSGGQKLKRRKTELGSSSSSPLSIRRTESSFLDFDSPGQYWKKTNLSNSAQTPKKKETCEDMESPTKELRSKLQSINLDDDPELSDSFELETEEFRLPDEQDSSDDEDETLSQGEEFASLPVRYLDWFTFFDEKSKEMIGLDYLEEPDLGDDISPYFIGRVIARNLQSQEDDESVDSEDSVSEVLPVMLRSSSVLTVWESEAPEEDGVVSENSDIWVRTSYAWYILDRPSPEYRNIYLPRWLHHKLYILVLHLRRKATPTVSHFERHFLKNEATWATYEFGRELTLDDLQKRMPEVLRTLKEDDYDLHDCPFIEELCGRYAPALSVYQPFSPGKRRRRREAQPPIQKKDVRLTKTFCTDFVWEIARPYFPSLRRRYTKSRLDSDSQDEEITLVENFSWPKVLSEGIIQSIKGDKIHEESNALNWIKIQGCKYKVGDIVMIRHEDTPEPLSGHPRDSVWFGLIILLFIEQDEKTSSDSDDEKTSIDSDDEPSVKAHILWLIPASHSSLNQLAHPQELVVVDECAEVDVRSFIAACQVSKLQPGELEPEIDENMFSFFYRYLWLGASANDDAFVDVDTFLKRKSPHNSHSHIVCPSCRSVQKGEDAATPRESRHGILFNKVEYHIHDTVYIVPDENCTVYIVGQIIEITLQHVLVRQFNRAVRPEGPHRFYNDRLLTFDPRFKLVKFQVDHIEGKCVVIPLPISQKNLAEDVFYLKNTDELPKCHLCSRSGDHAAIYGPPLMGLDLFSGAGGLSLGLESTGLVKTGWAVEFDASAARTFSESHPHSIVYNACLNQLLHHTADVHKGIERVPIKSLDTKEDLPPFPVEGDIDIIFGGPPCQGFSSLNHCPRADDPRNSLILSFLSSVEILKPKYVVLENVRGILMFRLGAHQVGLTRVEGGVPGGMVMLIKRVLMGLNYQVRHGVLQAGHYGSPQVRRRVIFMASRRGIPLPDLPQPTHLSNHSHSLGVKVIAKKGYHFTVSKRSNQAAPLGPVTVMDAIGDLPSWEKHPHIIIPKTLPSKAAEKKRGQLIHRIQASYRPPSLKIRGSGPGDPMPYGTLPTTSYQAWSRGSEGKVTQHFTASLNAQRVERVCSIPLKSIDKSKRFPDYDDLPEELKTRGRKHAYYGGGYGRLEADGAFPTALGTITPDAKFSQVIHPNQHRVITIREFARSQGFPDRVKFHHVSSSIKQITKQIGNAVPVPMAAALGREIVKVESRLRRLEEKQARAKREESLEL